MATLGTTIPDAIANCIRDMQDALIDCRPFADPEIEENVDFIDICINRAEKITKLAQALNRVNKKTEI